MRVSAVLQGGLEVDNPKWEWMDSIFGMIIGVISTISAMVGWINPKLNRLDKKIDENVKVLHDRVTPLAEAVAALKANHENDQRLLESINDKLSDIESFLRGKGRG